MNAEKYIESIKEKVQKKMDEEIRELKNLLFSVRSVVEDEMKYEFSDSHATRRLEEIVNKFKYEHGGIRSYE